MADGSTISRTQNLAAPEPFRFAAERSEGCVASTSCPISSPRVACEEGKKSPRARGTTIVRFHESPVKR